MALTLCHGRWSRPTSEIPDMLGSLVAETIIWRHADRLPYRLPKGKLIQVNRQASCAMSLAARSRPGDRECPQGAPGVQQEE
jgi:hypothetical protein